MSKIVGKAWFYSFCAVAALLAGTAQAKERRWYPVNMELGCVPLADLYAHTPATQDKTTPEQIVKALKVQYKNVKSGPFLDFLAEQNALEGKPKASPDPDQRVMRTMVTRSNAVYITWCAQEEVEDGILLFDAALCKKAYGKVPVD